MFYFSWIEGIIWSNSFTTEKGKGKFVYICSQPFHIAKVVLLCWDILETLTLFRIYIYSTWVAIPVLEGLRLTIASCVTFNNALVMIIKMSLFMSMTQNSVETPISMWSLVMHIWTLGIIVVSLTPCFFLSDLGRFIYGEKTKWGAILTKCSYCTYYREGRVSIIVIYYREGRVSIILPIREGRVSRLIYHKDRRRSRIVYLT